MAICSRPNAESANGNDDPVDELNLLIDLHIGAERQGPGDATQTRKAIALAELSPSSQLKVADIGCGTGASTLVLAQELRSQIIAVDNLPEFLGALRSRAEWAGVSDRITTMSASMDSLPFEDGSLDVMWSEGAIYNIGFSNGIRHWRRFLKPGGLLAVSELTWLTARRPSELEEYWRAQYADVATASSKMDVLERAGYEPVGYFVLPEHCWIDAYYRPMQRRFPAFLERHGSSEAAKAVVAAEVLEIDLYKRFRRFVSYGFYIARKIDDGP
jgi:SAM-dependent methyltransferase